MHLEIHPYRRILALIPFTDKVDMILPKRIACSNVGMLGIIFRHQVQSIDGSVDERCLGQSKLIVYTECRTIKSMSSTFTIHIGSMYSPFTMPRYMFSRCHIISLIERISSNGATFYSPNITTFSRTV